MKCQVVVVLVLMVAGATALKLPSYIIPCSRSDPKFKECATKNGHIGQREIIKGDRKYHFPIMDPIHVNEIVVDDSKGPVGLVIKLQNIDIHGFKDMKLESADMDFKKNMMMFTTSIPRIELDCMHNMSGKILILPISGHGPANFTLTNFKIKFDVFYELYKKPTGKEHIKLTGSKLDFTYDKAYLKFDNLFNGNKVLAEQMSNFINENSALMLKELGPPVGEAISTAFLGGFSYMVDKIPFDEYVLP